jgi:TonB family protein
VSELALAQQMVFSGVEYERPVRPRPTEDRLMSRALVASVLLHVLFLCGGVLGYWFCVSAPAVGPREFDVTLVELTANETVLPPPQLPVQEPKARAVIPPPVEHKAPAPQPKREEPRVTVKDAAKVKAESKPQPTQNSAMGPSAPTSSASLSGGNESVQKARVSYHHMVATLLAKSKRYPERAVRGRVTGSGALRITIASTGDVQRVEVIESTQSTVLDDELLRMVERASPFPDFPAGMSQGDVTLVVPVAFRLEQ